MICSIAPAKIILFGEHFVVKGRPAIATAVNLYSKTCIGEHVEHVIESKQLGLKINLDRGEEAVQLKQFIEIYRLVSRETGVDKGFHAVIDSEIPIAAGLGSSASTAVSFTHALLTYYGAIPSPKTVSRIAYEAEKIVHGKPSGIDNTVSTYGGIIYYRRGLMERLTVEWPSTLSLVIIDSEVKRNTGQVVKKVLERYERHLEIMDKVYDAAEALVEKARVKLLKEAFEELGELMDINQGLLATIGVSIPETDQLIHVLKSLGALGAKISGAGMGGIVFGLFKEKSLQSVVDKLKSRGYRYYVVKPINEGVKYIEV